MGHSIVRKALIFTVIIAYIGSTLTVGINGTLWEINQANPLLTNNAQKLIHHGQKNIDDVLAASLFFTENQGQFPAEVLFQAITPEATVYLCRDTIVSVFARDTSMTYGGDSGIDRVLYSQNGLRTTEPKQTISVSAHFQGANKQTVVTGEGRLAHNNNYFRGNDSAKWYTNVPNYQKVIYHDIYPSVDLSYYSDNGLIKYDFIVHPGADLSQIQIKYTGCDELNVGRQGDLQVFTEFGMIRERTPVIYQTVHGITHGVSGGYRLLEPNVFGFDVKDYNPMVLLVIDPALEYSTFIGGTNDDTGYDIVVDSNGNTYITGETYSTDFPTTPLANDTEYENFGDVFVTKFSSSGDALVYSTFLGGNRIDYGDGIAVDGGGNVYVTGFTQSTDFPTTPNANDTDYNENGDCFVTMISSSGSTLVYSTYLGGTSSDNGHDLVVDGSGFAYIAGSTESSDFPTTAGAYNTSHSGAFDIFVTKLSISGESLEYSTFLGGADNEYGRGITVDVDGYTYLTGDTYSTDFPTTPGVYDTESDTNGDVFITKISSSGSTLIYSTFLGGASGDYGKSIMIDGDENAYITGITESSDFPTTPSAYDTDHNGASDVFVTTLSSTAATLLYGTFLGGTSDDSSYGIAVDANEFIYITGDTSSSDFPTTPGAYDLEYGGNIDAFLTKLSLTGGALLYSTYLGGTEIDSGAGIVVDDDGNAYITGSTGSSNFPTTVGAYNTNHTGASDVFVAKLNLNRSPLFDPPTPANGSTNNPVSFSWEIPISDPEGDLFDWTIQCSNGQTTSEAGDSNGTKSLSLSNLTYSTTYTIWLNATDPSGSGLFTRSWYTFTTKTNLRPVFGTPTPGNNSENHPLVLTWYIPISDPEANLFDWSIECNNTQSMEESNSPNGTKSLSLSNLVYSTTYTIWVNATDKNGSGLTAKARYTFRTKLENSPPIFGIPSPMNNSTGNPRSFTWGIPIEDLEGDEFNWSVECSNGQMSNGSGAVNGTKNLGLSGLSYAETYTVWVNATDPENSKLYTREWYKFTTIANLPPVFGAPSPRNFTTGLSLSLTWRIPISDPEGDLFTWTIQCSNGQKSNGSGAVNGTKNLGLSGLSYAKNYRVWVNVTDPVGSGQYTRAWYNFSTASSDGSQGGYPPGGDDEPLNKKPIADASAEEPYEGSVNTMIIFDGSRSSDPDGNITTWSWDFGDETTGTGMTIEHSFSDPGTYLVILTVTDDDGATGSNTTSCLIRYQNRPPTTPVLSGPRSGSRNTMYSYKGFSTDPDNESIRYTFDWGEFESQTSGYVPSATNYTMNHSWSAAGRYIVTLTVSDHQEEISTNMTVYIDAVQTRGAGYLLDTDGDGIYDAFYSEESKKTVSTLQQQGDSYYIDSDGDGEWDYKYNATYGITSYQKPQKTPGFELVFVVVAIACVLFFRRFKKR